MCGRIVLGTSAKESQVREHVIRSITYLYKPCVMHGINMCEVNWTKIYNIIFYRSNRHTWGSHKFRANTWYVGSGMFGE